MSNLYNKEEYCMNFGNEEIEKYLLQPIREKTKIVISLSLEDIENFYMGNETIESIYFDGHTGNFIISFYGHQTSIFISDETPMPDRKFTFNEEFMFIDDDAKEHIVSSDTEGNVVYEGTLRDKTHKEILGLLCEIVTLLIGAKKITVSETVISQSGWQYPKCEYIVKITNDSGVNTEVRYNNILFCINE